MESHNEKAINMKEWKESKKDLSVSSHNKYEQHNIVGLSTYLAMENKRDIVESTFHIIHLKGSNTCNPRGSKLDNKSAFY